MLRENSILGVYSLPTSEYGWKIIDGVCVCVFVAVTTDVKGQFSLCVVKTMQTPNTSLKLSLISMSPKGDRAIY